MDTMAKATHSCASVGIHDMDVSEDRLLFVAFCTEMYARRHGISGGQTMRVFDAHGVFRFLLDEYEPLHSQDREAIVDDIELFIGKDDVNAVP